MIRTAMIFQDHMVLQRQKKIAVWGSCQPDGPVTVILGGESASTIAKGGTWQVELPPMEAAEGLTMTISHGEEQILLQDIVIGEVWLAGGQSNMEFYLRYDSQREQAEENPNIRWFDYPKVAYEGELEEFDYSDFGIWRSCTRKNLDFYSAAAYYFAQKIQKYCKVPVGIVGCTWGGTPACAWQDPAYLQEHEGRAWLEDYDRVLQELDPEVYEEHFRRNPENYKGKPFENAFQEKMMRGMTLEELMAEIRVRMASGEVQMMPMEGPKSERRPGGLYENMLRKLIPYTIRGFLWYQGETDETHPDVYDKVFGSLIRCWRDQWQEQLPFLFVQLAPFAYWTPEGKRIYPMLRERQQWVRDNTPECWMASIMDEGMEHDIHPKNKQPVGERLALLALAHVYGESIPADPPECVQMKVEEGCVTLHFSNAGKGMYLKGEQVNSLELLVNDTSVDGYSCRVEGACLSIKSASIASAALITVKFARQDYCQVNLYNGYGLPVLPFELYQSPNRLPDLSAS